MTLAEGQVVQDGLRDEICRAFSLYREENIAALVADVREGRVRFSGELDLIGKDEAERRSALMLWLVNSGASTEWLYVLSVKLRPEVTKLLWTRNGLYVERDL